MAKDLVAMGGDGGDEGDVRAHPLTVLFVDTLLKPPLKPQLKLLLITTLATLLLRTCRKARGVKKEGRSGIRDEDALSTVVGGGGRGRGTRSFRPASATLREAGSMAAAVV